MPPLVWYGYSRSTRAYPGTVMVGIEELGGYVEGVIKGLGESGFERVYVVSGHFSNRHLGALEKAEVKGVESPLLDFSRLG